MAVINTPQPDALASLVATIAQHVVRVWQDPRFQTVLKRETRRFVGSVASEARAASLRNRG